MFVYLLHVLYIYVLLILFVNKSKKCSFLPQVLASCNRTMQPNLLPGHLVLSAEASLKSAMDALLQDTLVMPLHFSRFPPARAQVLRTQGLQPMTLHKTLQSLYFSTANLKKKVVASGVPKPKNREADQCTTCFAP